MATFQPTDLPALFLWYRASSITGVAPGGSISSWIDESGSGVNLSVNTANGPAPTYHTNVINGFPTVRFSGGGYMTSVTHNQCLEIAPSSLCIYIVYRTQDCYTEQVLCANDHYFAPSQNRDFVLGLNYQGNSYPAPTPSGWFYSWGNQTTLLGGPKFSAIEANSPTFGDAFQPGNQFVLRADVFVPNAGLAYPTGTFTNGTGFYFDRYGANIAASSLVSNTVDTSSTFKIGWGDTITGHPFNGDIAEICAFSNAGAGNNTTKYFVPPNSYYGDYNFHEIMIDYLTQKYLIGAINTFSLYIGSTSNTNSGIPLYMPTKALVQSGITLYEHGISKGSGGCPLYIGSTLFASSGKPMYMYGLGNASKSTSLWITTQVLTALSGTDFPLYINSKPNSSITGVCTLYISTTGTASYNNNFPLYINAAPNFISGVSLPLYLGNYGPYFQSSSDFPLFMCGPPSGTVSGYFSLYLANNVSGSMPTGISLYTTSNQYLPLGSGFGSMPLFIERWPAAGFSLYTHGKLTSSNGIPLYLSNSVSGGVPLYIYGNSYASSIPPLTLYTYSQAFPSSTGTVPLFLNSATNASASGFYKNLPLYMSVVSKQANLPLYLQTDAIPLPEGFLPLFISGPIHTGISIGYTSLFLQQSSQLYSQSTKLYTKGLGTLNGGLPYQESMPLYIGRPTANLLPMFMWGKSSDSQSFPMVISGVFKGMGSIPLWIGQGLNVSSGTPGFIWGKSGDSQGITMTISGKPYIQDLMTMYERGF